MASYYLVFASVSWPEKSASSTVTASSSSTHHHAANQDILAININMVIDTPPQSAHRVKWMWQHAVHTSLALPLISLPLRVPRFRFHVGRMLERSASAARRLRRDVASKCIPPFEADLSQHQQSMRLWQTIRNLGVAPKARRPGAPKALRQWP